MCVYDLSVVFSVQYIQCHVLISAVVDSDMIGNTYSCSTILPFSKTSYLEGCSLIFALESD